MKNCVFDKDIATVGLRGIIERDYVLLCPFHAGMMQMILEKIGCADSVKWRPLYEKK